MLSYKHGKYFNDHNISNNLSDDPIVHQLDRLLDFISPHDVGNIKLKQILNHGALTMVLRKIVNHSITKPLLLVNQTMLER